MNTPSHSDPDKKELDFLRKNYDLKDLNVELAFSNFLQIKSFQSVPPFYKNSLY